MRPLGFFATILLPVSIAGTLLCLAIALWCPWWWQLFLYVPGTVVAWRLTHYTWDWARE